MPRILPALVAVLILMAACSSPAETTPEAAAEGDALVIQVGDTDAGEALVAPDGMTLYIFTNDSPGETTCFEGGCIEAWPPLTAEEGQAIEGGDGVDGTFDTIDRGDGTLQVTYEGYPLYFYAADSAPGDASGEGVSGVWFIATASGEVPEA